MVLKQSNVHQGVRVKASQLADQNARKGELIESTYDYVIASRSLPGKIRNREVVGDFVSRPHKTVSFVVGKGQRIPGVARTNKCLKHYQASVESCQEEAQQKKV